MIYISRGRTWYGNRKNVSIKNLMFLEEWLCAYDAEHDPQAQEIADLLAWLNAEIVRKHIREAKKLLRQTNKEGA